MRGLNEDLVNIFLSQSDDGVADQVSSHAAFGSLEDTGDFFIRNETEISKTVRHMFFTGYPDYFHGLAQIYLT